MRRISEPHDSLWRRLGRALAPEDIEENELSLKEGFRLLSAYQDRHASSSGSSRKRIAR